MNDNTLSYSEFINQFTGDDYISDPSVEAPTIVLNIAYIDFVINLYKFIFIAKLLHWNSSSMTDHELLDTYIKTVSEAIDDIVEIGLSKPGPRLIVPEKTFLKALGSCLSRYADVEMENDAASAALTDADYANSIMLCVNSLDLLHRTLYLTTLMVDDLKSSINDDHQVLEALHSRCEKFLRDLSKLAYQVRIEK